MTNEDNPWTGETLEELLVLTYADGARVDQEGSVPNVGFFKCTWVNEHGSGWARVKRRIAPPLTRGLKLKDDAIRDYREASDEEEEAYLRLIGARAAFAAARALARDRLSILRHRYHIFETED